MSKKYFEWLKNKVDFLDFPEKYDNLFMALYNTEFIWVHPMDRNRAFEGQDLRAEYSNETVSKIPIGISVPANVLEVIIAITKRMNFICSSFDEDKTKIIFWRLIANLGLAEMSDPNYIRFGGDGRVEAILTNWMERRYEPDGRGGLFPLAEPRENQREVELWYQMNQYLNDPNGEDLRSY